MALNVRSIDNLLGTPVPYAYAVKTEPWLFLTGHEAYEWRTGMAGEAVSGPAGYPLFGHHHKIRREADFIFGRMRRVLGEFGSDFAHSIRLDQYYPHPRAVAAYHLARHHAFGGYIPPSTSVVMERCFDSRSTISTSLIAVVPKAGYQIRKIHPPGVASAPTSGFVPVIVCNEFVFVAGQMAHGPGTGLDPRVIVPAHGACRAAGTSMDRLLRAQYFVADITVFPGIAMAWSARYVGQPHPFVCVQTPQPMPAPACAIIGDFWISTVS